MNFPKGAKQLISQISEDKDLSDFEHWGQSKFWEVLLVCPDGESVTRSRVLSCFINTNSLSVYIRAHFKLTLKKNEQVSLRSEKQNHP